MLLKKTYSVDMYSKRENLIQTRHFNLCTTLLNDKIIPVDLDVLDVWLH